MKTIKYIVLIILLLNSNLAKCQKVFSAIINDYTEYNPAGLSTIDKYQINLKTNNFIFDNYSFNGGYLNAAIPFKKINSHIGVNAQFKIYDDLKDFKYGLSYSYSYKPSEKSYLAIGARASIYSFQDNYYMYIINNEYYIEKTFKSNKLNIDAGIWFQNNNLGIGVSYNHINSPEHKPKVKIDPKYPNPYLYQPEFNAIVNHKMNISENLIMENSLYLFDVTNMSELTEINFNNIFILNKTFLFGSAWEYLKNDYSRLRFFNVLGFNLNDKYKIFLAHSLKEFFSKEDYFVNTSKRVRSDLECSFIINI